MGARVSFFSLHFPPDSTGIAPYAGALAATLAARGHTVTANVAHPFYPEWRIRSGYGQWHRVDTLDGVRTHRLRHYVPRPPRGIRRLVSEVTFGLRSVFRPIDRRSVVIAISPALFATALLALRVRLTPARPALVVWVQDIYTLGMSETGEGGGISTAVAKLVERWTLRSADRVIAIHPRFASYLREGLGVDPARVTVIRNWTHLEPLPPLSTRDARAALGWPSDVRLVVHTGNMGAKQGLDNVVEAARLADEAQSPIVFVLVGDGGERERLQDAARDVERIRFVPPLADEDYRRALAAADILLVNELPGVASMAVPSKLTSYFHAARPVIAATDPDGITADEIRRSSAGVVVRSGDPAALLATALEMSDTNPFGDSYGEAGRHYCQVNLTADAAVTAFERVITDVAHRRTRSCSFPAVVG